MIYIDSRNGSIKVEMQGDPKDVMTDLSIACAQIVIEMTGVFGLTPEHSLAVFMGGVRKAMDIINTPNDKHIQ